MNPDSGQFSGYAIPTLRRTQRLGLQDHVHSLPPKKVGDSCNSRVKRNCYNKAGS